MTLVTDEGMGQVRRLVGSPNAGCPQYRGSTQASGHLGLEGSGFFPISHVEINSGSAGTSLSYSDLGPGSVIVAFGAKITLEMGACGFEKKYLL